VVLAVLFLCLAKGAVVAVPLLYKQAVDVLSGPLVTMVPVAVLLAYAGARVASSVFSELRDLAFVAVGQRAVRDAGLAVFRHLHALSLRFHLDRRTGGLSRAIERGNRGIEYLLNFMLFSILPTLLEITLVAAVLWRMYDGVFAAATVATILSYIAFTLWVAEWRAKFRRAMNESDSEAASRATDSLLNFETVKYFANEEHEARRFDSALARFERAAIVSKSTTSMMNVGQGLIVAAGLAAVMLLAGQGVAEGRMTLGDFVLVNTYIIQLYIPLNFLGFVYREVKHALTDIESMLGLLSVPPEVADKAAAQPLALAGGSIRFDGVHFGYDPARPVLKGVSFTVPAGGTVAIVGPSGAGKSTVARLLYRFHDVQSGLIAIDGQDIRNVTQDSLRRAIGVVPQDTVLFNDTIAYNIAYGRPEADGEDVAEAARLAHLDRLLSTLPEGGATRVGERGLKLSGGEKQRVAIARTLLKNPAILLLDEATSALDSHTERDIQDALKAVSRDRTTLVIAHRLSTVVDADRILVLRDGEVAEQGTHSELLARDGVYASMWRRQHQQPAAVPGSLLVACEA
jgi:ATP-binding cassette subfamily B protein